MYPAEPLSRKLETLTLEDCVEALKSGFAEKFRPEGPVRESLAVCARYPIHARLDEHYLNASRFGARRTPTTAFLVGMQLGFGAVQLLAERRAAAGDPGLETALRSLSSARLDRDLPVLFRLAVNNLPAWRKRYPTFLAGSKLSNHYLGRSRERPVACLPLYNGIFAMETWLVHALRQPDPAAA